MTATLRSRARAAGLAAAAVAALLAPRPAAAGGFGRPNSISARGVGFAGAFTAIADDPTALHYNPAGLGFLSANDVQVGLELVVAPRTFVPIDAAGERGASQDATPVAPLPSLGFAYRLTQDDVPTGAVIGIGLWNSYGGSLEYDPLPPGTPAINSTTEAVLEVVPGVGYQINDVVAVGIGVRVGIGLFDANTSVKPLDTTLSTRGVGIGASIGILVRPTDSLSLGAVWRSPLDVTVKGQGTLGTTPVMDVDVEHTQHWPQSAGLSAALRPIPALLVAAQVDWTQWSRLDDLQIVFPAQSAFNQTFPLDWRDSWALRLGGELRASDRAQLRLGVSYDTNAVPDRTIERQYLDGDKLSGTAGASLQLSRSMRIDLAFEVMLGQPRTVADNSDEARDAGWLEHANVAPGEYNGDVFTGELAFHYLF
jgi:long-chain fatty acid transport protein